MSGFEVGLISVGAMLVMIIAGVHVGVVLALASFVGVWAIRDNFGIAVNLLVLAVSDSVSNYVFGVIPLFVLMGLFVSVAEVGRDTYQVANQVFRRLRGGLGVATIAANTFFAAITGVSIASASVFTRLAVPEMLRYGYQPRFAVGVVAGSSVLGMLIPPSLLLILYAILTDQSVGDMFLAGIIPGLLLATTFAAAVIAAGRFAPRFILLPARSTIAAEEPLMSWGEMAVKLVPIVVLIALVLGGIYGGLFTATEAGGIGAFGAFLIALAKRALTPRKLWSVVEETGQITAVICFLIIAATMYSRMLGLGGVPTQLGNLVAASGLGLYGLLAIYLAIILLLGMLIDAASTMMIVVPLFLPLFTALGVDLVWLGVLTVVAVEIGLLTPPFGVSCFVVKASLPDQRVTLNDVFLGALPFAGVMLVFVVLLIAFPCLATLLT
jgi:tripartite ATP-independent transporter DctM subunit